MPSRAGPCSAVTGRAKAFVEQVIARYLSRNDDRYTHLANVQSYNLSANLADCWPGEENPRERHHFEAGLAAAERCVALRTQLKKDNISMARAHWMAGAHQLALRRFGDAEESFRTA